MYKDKYQIKREQFRISNPFLSNKKLNFYIRLSIIIIFLIVTKVSQYNLDYYDVKCYKDVVLNYYKDNNLIFGDENMRIIFIFIVIFNIILLFSHWLWYSYSWRLIINIIIFFILKIFIDLCLFIKFPENDYFKDINIFVFKVSLKHLFYSNVDPFIGILLLSLFYFMNSTNISNVKKIIYFFYNLFCIYYIFIFLMKFQLAFFYSIVSGIIISLFSDAVSDKLYKKYDDIFFNNKKNSNNENLVKIECK